MRNSFGCSRFLHPVVLTNISNNIQVINKLFSQTNKINHSCVNIQGHTQGGVGVKPPP